MTDAEPQSETPRDEVLRRAKAAGIEYELEDWIDVGGDEAGSVRYSLHIPNGREKYTIAVTDYRARWLAQLPFDEYTVLGLNKAIYHRADYYIEAVLQPAKGPGPTLRDLLMLPGIEAFTRDSPAEYPGKILGGYEAWPHLADYDLQLDTYSPKVEWRLPIISPPKNMKIEISPISRDIANFFALRSVDRMGLPDRLSLKMRNVSYATHDAALAALEDIAASVLFDLDVRFNITYSLAKRTQIVPQHIRTPSSEDKPVTFPATKFSRTSTTLYFYGKSAPQMPLLSYLAYYQAIEYFFPVFFERETIGRLKNRLKAPDFNANADHDLQQILQLATRGGRSESGEPAQLKATLTMSIEETDIKDFLKAHKDVYEFINKNNALSGVPQVSLERSDQLLAHQVSARIYALRNRIVHTKDSRSDKDPKPLLPHSAEASNLRYDLELIEFVCQKVIIAGSNETF